MSEYIDTNRINQFAQELVQGSDTALLVAQTTAREAFVTAYGQGPTSEQAAVVEELFPYHRSDSYYHLSPQGVKTVDSESHGRYLEFGDFIKQIATFDDREPTDKEIQCAIFLVGKYMGDLEPRNG